MDRIGLSRRKRIGAADRREARTQTERLEQKKRQPLRLVGADGENVAAGRKLVEHRDDIRIERGFVGDVEFVMGEERARELLEPFRRNRVAAQVQTAREHDPDPAADQLVHVADQDRFEIFERQRNVQAAHEVGGGVDERAVEIEDKGRSGHGMRSHDWDGRISLGNITRRHPSRHG